MFVCRSFSILNVQICLFLFDFPIVFMFCFMFYVFCTWPAFLGYFLHLQLFGELLDSMALGNSKDGADFVSAQDVR